MRHFSDAGSRLYTHFPEIDPRLRNYRSRYGAISND
ncbi:DUF2856 family protein [Escherichia coli]|nr:DUF2856 family protein [Escherichia coli]EGO4626619.1 DUF2856 family protein [Escherichia coli]